MEIVKIGNQEWSTINLDTDKFNNGDTIPEIQNMDEWNQASKKKQPAFCYYDNNSSNGELYGKLYNWYAVTDPRGLAPDGFRIPSKIDLEELMGNLVGGVDMKTNNISEYLVAGKDLKQNISDWMQPSISKAKLKEISKLEKTTIESLNIADLKIGEGFNALPGGFRNSVRFSDFIGGNRIARFWTISKDEYVYDAEQIAHGIPIMAYDFTLTYLSDFGIGKGDVRCGNSVRLLKL
jgi:uncharacterized protein (TIGR02145 family)